MILENGNRRPYEIFINTKNLQHLSWMVAMTRLISAVFRREPNPKFLLEELKSVYDPNGGYFKKGKFVPSLVADIGLIIEQHLEKIGLIKKLTEHPEYEIHVVDDSKQNNNAMICPECNDKALIMSDGCMKCLSCNYSKCG